MLLLVIIALITWRRDRKARQQRRRSIATFFSACIPQSPPPYDAGVTVHSFSTTSAGDTQGSADAPVSYSGLHNDSDKDQEQNLALVSEVVVQMGKANSNPAASTSHVASPKSSTLAPTMSGASSSTDASKSSALATTMSGASSSSGAPARNAREAACTAILSAKELTAATSGFSEAHLLGRGGFGCVYAALTAQISSLPGERSHVAVKRLDVQSSQGVQELLNEIQVLGQCKHEHLLPLVGFCLEPEVRALVYPLMEGGNLEDRLLLSDAARERLAHLVDPSQLEPLTWKQRLRIMRDAMRALDFLHRKTASKEMLLQ